MRTPEEIRSAIHLIIEWIKSDSCSPFDIHCALGTIEGMS